MCERQPPHKPKNLAEDMILCDQLIQQGNKATDKRLAKAKKDSYLEKESPADCSNWWNYLKDGKKKDKMAMVMMASQYPQLARHLKISQSKVLELEDKTKSQEEELKLMKVKLQQQEEEKARLKHEVCNNSGKVLELEAKTKFQEKEIKLMKVKLQQQEEEKAQLKDEVCNNSGKVLELEAKTKFQEKEIKLMKVKLQQQEEEKARLKDEVCDNSDKVLELEYKTKSQKKEIKSLKLKLLQYEEENIRLNDKISKEINTLKQRVQEQKDENEQLKDEMTDYKMSFDIPKNSLMFPAPSMWHRSFGVLLEELPDLQFDNSNYEFWAKIKNWLSKGEVDPRCAFNLVRTKCPLNAWQAIEKSFDNKHLTETAFSNPAMMGRLWEKLWHCASEVLRPGTNYFVRYYYQKQEAGETFEEYAKKKFTLYCSYGVDKMEPNKNDRHFLYNVIEHAEKRYQNARLQNPTSYTDLLTKAMLIDRMLMEAECNNECSNCFRKSHTKATCRRPGGDMEVGPNQCYTCGGYNHWARDCWTYN